jgi:NitT/TauT family transport system permease protein
VATEGLARPAGATLGDAGPGDPVKTGRLPWHLRIGIAAWRLIALVAFLVVWHLVSIPAGKLILPSPLDVVPAFVTLLFSGQLLVATGSSLAVFMAGYLLAVVTALPLGILMGGYRRLGLGVPAKIGIVWFTAVLPMVINTYAGVLNSDPELIEAARSFGAKPGQIFWKVMMPSAVPYIVAGLRIGASLAIIGTVVAELYTALSGLGFMLAQFGNTFQTAKYFVPVIVLVFVGVAISQALKALEHRVAAWKATTLEL